MRDELWVKHDVRSRVDGKMRWFLKHTGMQGYGAFWGTVEILHYQNDHEIPLLGIEFDGIADELGLPPDTYRSILKTAVQAHLFQASEERLWQNRLKQTQANRSKPKQNLSKIRSEAGRKGGQARGKKQEKISPEPEKESDFASNFASKQNPSKTEFLLPPKDNQIEALEAKFKQTEANALDKKRIDLLVDTNVSPNKEGEAKPLPKQAKIKFTWPPPGTEVAPGIFLTPEQRTSLEQKMTPEEVEYWIQELTGVAQQGMEAWKKRFENHSLVIQNWRRRRLEDGKQWDANKKLYIKSNGFFQGNIVRKSQAELNRENNIEVTKAILMEAKLCG